MYERTYARLKIYTDDPTTENLKAGSSFPSDRRILLSDEQFNGGQYQLRFYVERKDFKSAFFAGRVLIRIKSVSKDYFDYLKLFEQSVSDADDNTFSKPVIIPGNVTNGLGIIGGVYLREFQFVFDDFRF